MNALGIVMQHIQEDLIAACTLQSDAFRRCKNRVVGNDTVCREAQIDACVARQAERIIALNYIVRWRGAAAVRQASGPVNENAAMTVVAGYIAPEP